MFARSLKRKCVCAPVQIQELVFVHILYIGYMPIVYFIISKRSLFISSISTGVATRISNCGYSLYVSPSKVSSSRKLHARPDIAVPYTRTSDITMNV